MQLGIDVCHKKDVDKEYNSVQGMSFSYDANYSDWSVEHKVLWNKENRVSEFISESDFKQIFDNVLKRFHKRNNYNPDIIIVYRDGISMSQDDYAD